MTEYIKTTSIWFIVSSLVFSGVVYILFHYDLVKETRNKRGELKKKQSIKGLMSIIIFALCVIAFLYFYDVAVFSGGKARFLNVLLVNFIMIMLVTAYDSFVIDLLVLGIIRPAFLKIPDEMDLNEMKKHVKRTYVVGWIFIVPLTLIPSILYALVN